MLDHIGIRVSSYQRSKLFFEAALRPLGYRLVFEHAISGAEWWLDPRQPGPGAHSHQANDDVFYDASERPFHLHTAGTRVPRSRFAYGPRVTGGNPAWEKPGRR